MPFDPEIEFLEAVLDPGTMLGIFRSLPGQTAGNLPTAVDTRILRCLPGRAHAVVEYRLTVDGSEPDFYIGKVFAKRRRAKRLQRVLDATWGHLGPRTPAPVPLAFLEQHALVLMHRLEGEPLAQILVGDSAAAAEEASRLAAGSLASLHSVPIEEGKAGSLEDELLDMRGHADEWRAAPALAAEGQQLLDDIEARARRLPQPGPPTLIHGSFRPTEVLVGAGKASIFDLDGWALGDRALDLGYYLSDVWWESSKNGEVRIRPWAERMLEQYLEEADAPGLRERVHLYEAFAHTRVMLKKLRSVTRGASAEEQAEKLALAERLRDRARSRLAMAGA